MSFYFPTTDYAEDQPLPRTILTTHVLVRGFQLGTAVGLLNTSAGFLLRRRAITTPIILRSAGTGGLIGAGIAGAALVVRMWGRDEIEWKDRSWRLRYNAGQVAVDNWGESAAAVGVALVAVRGLAGAAPGRWRGVVGGAGVGSLIGVAGCMVAKGLSLSRGGNDGDGKL